MAYHTQTRRDNRMDVFVSEHRFAVAVIAEVGQLFPEQPLEIRLMRLVTRHALARGNRRMLHLQPHDLVLAVASEADVGNLVPEKLITLPCMGVMAQQTLPVVNRTVDPEFPAKERFIMTDKAELGCGLQEQFFHLSAVRIMARSAHAAGHRRMDRVVLEHCLAVAAVAELGHRQEKEARVIGVMHVVARKAAAFGNRWMLD